MEIFAGITKACYKCKHQMPDFAQNPNVFKAPANSPIMNDKPTQKGNGESNVQFVSPIRGSSSLGTTPKKYYYFVPHYEHPPYYPYGMHFGPQNPMGGPHFKRDAPSPAQSLFVVQKMQQVLENMQNKINNFTCALEEMGLVSIPTR